MNQYKNIMSIYQRDATQYYWYYEESHDFGYCWIQSKAAITSINMNYRIMYIFAGDPAYHITVKTSGANTGKLTITAGSNINFLVNSESFSVDPAPGCTFATNEWEAIRSHGDFGGTATQPLHFFCIPQLCSGLKKYYCGAFPANFNPGFIYGTNLTELPDSDSHDNTCFLKVNTEGMFLVKKSDNTIKFL